MARTDDHALELLSVEMGGAVTVLGCGWGHPYAPGPTGAPVQGAPAMTTAPDPDSFSLANFSAWL